MVQENVTTNEFIMMLKHTFYSNVDIVELKDIWLYRIIQNYDKKAGKIKNSFVKITYDL